jgi:hypothetical protein
MNRRSDERYSERHDKSHVSNYSISDWVCAEATKLDVFWLEFSAEFATRLGSVTRPFFSSKKQYDGLLPSEMQL